MINYSVRFLWVAFQLEDLCHQKCDADIRKALRTLPRDLTETYNRILIRIVKDRNEQIVSKIFRWVAAAKRPLHLDELQEAIAIEPKDPYLRKDRLVTNINNIISWCGGLTILQEEDSVVQFAHHSVREFLLSDHYDMRTKSLHFRLPTVDHDVGEICVTYLHFNDFERQVSCPPKQSLLFQPKDLAANIFVGSRNRAVRYGANFVKMFSNPARPKTYDITEQLNKSLGKNNSVNIDQLHSGYPFLVYVKQFWLLHTIEFSQQNTSTWDLWADLILRKHHLAVKPWTMKSSEHQEEMIKNYILAENHLALLSFFCHSKNRSPFSNQSLCLLLIEASGTGNAQFVKRFIKAIEDDEFLPGPSLQTALVVAAEEGHLEVVELLLTTKTSLDIDCGYKKRKAFDVAAMRGHLEVVELLLSAHVDLTPDSNDTPSTLILAVAGGHVKVVEVLLSTYASLDISIDFGVLFRAMAENDQIQMMEFLTSPEANVNVKHYLLSNEALNEAVKGGHTEVVEILLRVENQASASGEYFDAATLQWHYIQRQSTVTQK